MASRKEEEKNEKIIRGLTKLPENRKCINCGSLGPQYVCTNFSIFVCITCSGLHREFTHRVKSISMAHFTNAEVGALQAGGNQRARDIYLKEWDSSRHSLPDSSNPDKLREFIKSVYVEKRFSGERQQQQRERGRWSDTDEGNDVRKPDRPKFAQSPSYEDRYDDRRYTTNGPVSRGSDRGYDDKMSPARFENDRDRRHDDRRSDDRDRRYERDRSFDDRRNEDRYEDRDRRNDDRDRRFDNEDRERRLEEPRGPRRTSDDWDARRRPPSYRGGETPPIRSVRDILGEDVPKLRVEDASRVANGRVEDSESPRSVSSQGDTRLRGNLTSMKSMGSSKSLDSAASTNGTSSIQNTISESLIDFAAEPEAPKVNPTTASDPFGQPKTSTSFDPFGTFQQPNTTTNFDPFSTSSQQPTPSTSFDPFATSEPPKNTSADPFGGASTTGWASFDLSPTKVPATTNSAVPSTSTSFFDQPLNPVSQPNVNGTMAPQQTGWPSNRPQAPVAAPGFQDWIQSQQQQQPPPFQTPQSLPPQQNAAENGSQQQQGRRPIPENLFAMPPPYGMQMHMPQNFGYAQPPPFAAQMLGPVPSYGQPSSSKNNPFDLPGDSAFPSMSSMHNALPSYNAGSQSSPAPALGGPLPQWPQSGLVAPSHGPPASYPAASYPPFSGAGFNQQPAVPAHLMQSNFGRPNPGGFMNGPAYGGNQPPLQPASGNPFG